MTASAADPLANRVRSARRVDDWLSPGDFPCLTPSPLIEGGDRLAWRRARARLRALAIDPPPIVAEWPRAAREPAWVRRWLGWWPTAPGARLWAVLWLALGVWCLMFALMSLAAWGLR